MIEITPSQAAIFSIAFTMAGALIGALASVYAARLAAEKQQLYVESARFIGAFVHEIIGLRKASSDAYEIVDDAPIEKDLDEGAPDYKSESSQVTSGAIVTFNFCEDCLKIRRFARLRRC